MLKTDAQHKGRITHALEALYDDVCRYCKKKFGADAEDIAQEAVMKVLRFSGPLPEDESGLKRYIFKAAFRCWIDLKRQRKPHDPTALDNLSVEQDRSDSFTTADEAAALSRAYPPHPQWTQRESDLELFYVYGCKLSTEDVIDYYACHGRKISRNALYKWFHDAEKRMEKYRRADFPIAPPGSDSLEVSR